MQVIRAETAGFCFGVSRALQLLDKEIADISAMPAHEDRPRLMTLGPIIHNPRVMNEYARQGVICLEDERSIRPGDRVVIRAHGIPREQEERLLALGAELVDATCPKVKAAQNAIAGYQRKTGGTLLLFGEADHPEVQGLISYSSGTPVVFDSLEALKKCAISPKERYYLASQTTQDKRLLPELVAYLQGILHEDIPVLDTICNATRNRQDEVVRLAPQVQAMVVVGGLNSGNTKRLADIAKTYGIPTVHVESTEDFDLETVRGMRLIGLTAGASTPKGHIDAMHRFLLALE